MAGEEALRAGKAPSSRQRAEKGELHRLQMQQQCHDPSRHGCHQNDEDGVGQTFHVPCVKRNVIGAVNAVSSADMALAGIQSRVPVDQVIDCMGEVGRRLPVEFRETALGGLAATPFGQSVKASMEKKRECHCAREEAAQ